MRYKSYFTFFCIGFLTAAWIFTLKIDVIRSEFNAERIALLEKTNTVLTTNQQINNALEHELTQVKNELEIKAQQLESVRNEAIKKDGNSYNGIGVNSLQHYKKALGYDN